MSNLGIYKINEEMYSLIEEIQEAEGEVTEEQISKLEILRENLEPSVLRYDSIIKFLESQNDLIDRESTRINKCKERNNKIVEAFKGALLQSLLLFGEEDKKGIKRLEIGTIKLSTRKSSSVNILDQEELDLDYCKIEATTKLNTKESIEEFKTMFPEGSVVISPIKKLIKDDIDKGIEVKGAEVISKFGLTIK